MFLNFPILEYFYFRISQFSNFSVLKLPCLLILQFPTISATKFANVSILKFLNITVSKFPNFLRLWTSSNFVQSSPVLEIYEMSTQGTLQPFNPFNNVSVSAETRLKTGRITRRCCPPAVRPVSPANLHFMRTSN